MANHSSFYDGQSYPCEVSSQLHVIYLLSKTILPKTDGEARVAFLKIHVEIKPGGGGVHLVAWDVVC